MAHTTTTLAAAARESRIREAVAHTGSSSLERRMAHILLEVGATDDVVVALGAAARLLAQNVMPATVRRNYGLGGITYDFVNEAVAAAS